MNWKWLLFFIGFSLLYSCGNKQLYKDYAAKTDSLKTTLEISAVEYEKLDSVLYISQFKIMTDELDSIRMIADSILVPEFIEYGYVRKRYKTFLREHPLTIKELNYSRQQLTDLKNDIEKRALDEEDVLKYFAMEAEAIRYLKKRMDIYRESILRNQEKFDGLNPKVHILVDSIKQAKAGD